MMNPPAQLPRDVARYAEVIARQGSPARHSGASLRENSAAGGGVIRGWDDIPDAASMPAPELEWIVDGLLPRGSITLIAGEPGTYKSWLALELLRAVTCGENFLGRACRAADVLYLDRENPFSVVRRRMSILGIDSRPEARIWGGWLADAPPAIGDVRLLEVARQRRPVMIFDSLIRFHEGEENSATEMAEVMQELRALAHAGATLVLLHHRAKSETSRYRGSSDIAGGVDTAISISRDRKAGLLTLECFKSRYVEEFSVTLRPELNAGGGFEVTAGPKEAVEFELAEKLAEAIRARPGITQSELVAETGLPRNRTLALLSSLEGQLWRSERGANNRAQYFPLEDLEDSIPATG
jgi:AAA domain-containing protein